MSGIPKLLLEMTAVTREPAGDSCPPFQDARHHPDVLSQTAWRENIFHYRRAPSPMGGLGNHFPQPVWEDDLVVG